MDIKTNDGIVVWLGMDIVDCSRLLQDIRELDEDPVPLYNIDSKVLRTIIRACEDPANVFAHVLDTDRQHMVDVLQGLNYLDMPALLDTACDVIADRIQGMTEHKVYEFLSG